MAFTVRFYDDPAAVLADAGAFLEGEPVAHNLILTLLHQRVNNPEPGRYWVVADGAPVGVVLQSPLDFFAAVTPMPEQAARAVVDTVVDAGIQLPGINGEAATAAAFAGHWTERTKTGARPVHGQRLYDVDTVVAARATTGGVRVAEPADRDVVTEWLEAFHVELGEPMRPFAAIADQRIAVGGFWLWDDDGPVALSGRSQPVANTVRIGPVYTPPEQRGRGYASALVAAHSSDARNAGHRCILYTDLNNPTSNAIYRSLGYRAVAELVRYDLTVRA